MLKKLKVLLPVTILIAVFFWMIGSSAPSTSFDDLENTLNVMKEETGFDEYVQRRKASVQEMADKSFKKNDREWAATGYRSMFNKTKDRDFIRENAENKWKDAQTFVPILEEEVRQMSEEDRAKYEGEHSLWKLEYSAFKKELENELERGPLEDIGHIKKGRSVTEWKNNEIIDYDALFYDEMDRMRVEGVGARDYLGVEYRSFQKENQNSPPHRSPHDNGFSEKLEELFEEGPLNKDGSIKPGRSITELTHNDFVDYDSLFFDEEDRAILEAGGDKSPQKPVRSKAIRVYMDPEMFYRFKPLLKRGERVNYFSAYRENGKIILEPQKS